MAAPGGAKIEPQKVDDRVAVVVENWFPRFIANGLDYLDVRRTLGGITSWSEWAGVWSETAERYERLGLDALDAGHVSTAAAHLRRAALTYQFAQFVLTGDVHEREQIHRRMARAYALAAPYLVPPAEPFGVPWGGGMLPGYLRSVSREAPLVVLIPGLESTKEQFSTFEPYLLERGMATLSFEGPGQGEGWYLEAFRNDGYLDAVRRLFGVIAKHPQLSGRPVALLGTSFGGYLALRCAAEVDVAGVVDIAGFYDLSGLEDLQPVIRENLAHFMKVSVAELPELTSDVSLAGSLPLGARVLVVHGEKDPIVPVENARRIAEAQPDADLWLFPEGNHSCNNIHTIVRPAIADWLADLLETA